MSATGSGRSPGPLARRTGVCVGILVRVRLFAPFDRLCGRRDAVVEFPGTPTLADVLIRLVAEHPALERYLLRRTGDGAVDFTDYFLACVGETILLPDDVLSDGAEVKLFAPHAGG
ncbi:MAG: MoaD/ThiS family protein [candidate division NC10 bacterium]|nr:MoaD/ThiS family protein [candidate division NC10 bacterium]